MSYYTTYIKSRPEYELAGIYADEGISGTGTKKRTDFNRMIKDCQDGKIDMVITKSISRFARNTQDCLQYSRMLRNMEIPIIFEKENINTDVSGELLFTILSSLAQEEARNISENTRWGIQSKFRKGIPHMHAARITGYDEDEKHKFIINEEQAKLVKRIYREFLEGVRIPEIASELNNEGVCGINGRPAWNMATIKAMLQNEFFKGDLRMQKGYTKDFLTKKQVKNEGRDAKYEQYYVENDHPAIIDKCDWEAVQLELDHQERFRKEHHITNLCRAHCSSAFISKVFCGRCGARYGRKQWGEKTCYWMCQNREKAHGGTCHNDNISEDELRRGFVLAWNSVVRNQAALIPGWQDMTQNGNPLEKLRAQQMLELASQGPIDTEVLEHTRMVLEEVIVNNDKELAYYFLDGTEKRILL